MTIKVEKNKEDNGTYSIRITRGFDLIATFFSMPDEAKEDFENRVRKDVGEIVADYV